MRAVQVRVFPVPLSSQRRKTSKQQGAILSGFRPIGCFFPHLRAFHDMLLHLTFKTFRINHSRAYADGGISTNQAESYFSRLVGWLKASTTMFRHSISTNMQTMGLGLRIIVASIQSACSARHQARISFAS
jgi:hypothetical protein